MKFYYSLFFLLLFLHVNGQHIFQGVVLNEDKKPINRARVFIKTKKQSKYTFTDKQGRYKIKYNTIQDVSVIISVDKIGYQKEEINLNFLKNKTFYTTNIELIKKVKQIREVVIKRKVKPPITIKKDTVVYNAKNFIDGSENNIEDLLKKLPGIKVSENGSIKFKGKTVVAVMLDGGNLFNSNYSVGTRNINPNIIEEVQAIEHWSENPILKSLNAENKVALNLKLKKNKTSFSASVNGKTDFYKRYDLGAYLLVANRLIKSFGTTNYNNVGVNKSPMNLGTNSFGNQEYLNQEYKAPDIINRQSIYSRFGSEKAYRNKQWFNSSNSIIRLGNKAHVKVIGSMVQDRILINNISENYYNLNNETIYTKDENSMVKTPLYFTGDIELRWNKSKKEFVKLYSTFNSLDENIDNYLLSNLTINNNTKINFKNRFSKNELIYTRKLKNKQALQIKALYTFNKKPEILESNRYLPVNLGNTNGIENKQKVNSLKRNLDLSVHLHRIFSDDNKMKTFLGFYNRKLSFNSSLSTNSNINLEDFRNHLTYKTNVIYAGLDYQMKNKGWDVTFNQNSQLYFQNLHYKSNVVNKNILLNQTNLFILKYLFYKTSAFFSGSISTSPINENKLFSNYILTSNRSIVSNKYSLESKLQEDYKIGFIYNDLLSNQFKGTFSVGYIKSNNMFTSKFNINSEIQYSLNYRLKKPFESFNINLNLEKFVSPISSRFHLKTNYMISKYYNNINDSELNLLTSKSLNVNLIHQIAFNAPLKIKNDFNFRYTTNQSVISNKNSNYSFSMKNDISYKLIRKKMVFRLTSEYFKPNFRQNEDLLFINFNYNYSPKKGKIKYSLSCKNILNQKYAYTKHLQDYVVNYNKIQLLNRYALLGINFSF